MKRNAMSRELFPMARNANGHMAQPIREFALNKIAPAQFNHLDARPGEPWT
jgi:hypothetical protein